MLQVTTPQQLFAGTRLYRVGGNVDKRGGAASGPFRLCVVLTKAPDALPPPDKEMLEKLVKACKFNEGEVVYINASTGGVLFAAICRQYQPEAVLVFGDIVVSRNLVGLKRNYPYEFNGVKLLMAQSVEQVSKNATEKKALWEGLQKLI